MCDVVIESKRRAQCSSGSKVQRKRTAQLSETKVHQVYPVYQMTRRSSKWYSLDICLKKTMKGYYREKEVQLRSMEQSS